jgi:hypothetical protein
LLAQHGADRQDLLLSLARSTAHLGRLARAGGHSVTRSAGVGRLGVRGDGAKVRALLERASGRVRGSPVQLAPQVSIGTTEQR